MNDFPRKATGDAGVVRAYNKLLDCVKERTLIDVIGGKIKDRKPDGYVIEVTPPSAVASEPSTPSATFAVRIRVVKPDYLICNLVTYDVNGNLTAIGTDDMYVAKQFELRKKEWNNKVVNGILFNWPTTVQAGFTQAEIDAGTKRNATIVATSIVEIQEIIPAYVAEPTKDASKFGSIVIAQDAPGNGTGVHYSESSGTITGECLLMEMSPNRAWAEAVL